MSDQQRTTLAIEKRRQIDEEKRQTKEKEKNVTIDMRQQQEKKEDRIFTLKTIILNHIIGILEGLVIAYLIYLWGFKK